VGAATVIISRLTQQTADDRTRGETTEKRADTMIVVVIVSVIMVAIIAIPIVSVSIPIMIVAVPAAAFAIGERAAGAVLAFFTALVWELRLLDVRRSRHLRSDRERTGRGNTAHGCRQR